MIATHDPDEFRASPIERCILGETFALWCAAPDLAGITLWGSLDERGLAEITALADFVRQAQIAPRWCLLVDCRDLERVDTDVLLAFSAKARDHVPDWAATIERQIVVPPRGINGILIAGTLAALGAVHPMTFVHEIDVAIANLDHPRAAEAHAAVDEIVSATGRRSPLLVQLRSHLRHDLAAVTVASCADALGLSSRTLQRELGREQTSFRDELRRVRIAAAEALLVHTALKIDAVASQVGFGCSSRMNQILRRELDVTASELRRHHHR